MKARSCAIARRWFRGAVALLLLVYMAPLPPGAESRNLVLNGDFSQTKDGKPVGWAASGDQSVVQTLDIVSDAGNPCARLVCTKCEKRSGASHAMIAQVGQVKLERGKYYEFSCRARAEGLQGRTVSVAISDMGAWQNCGLTTDLRLGKSWREFRQVFSATRTVGDRSRLQLWYVEPGTFYLDDVRIVEVSQQAVEFTDVILAAGGKNLVPNGSFEIGETGWSSLGRGAGWGNLARLHGKVEVAGGTHNRSFLRISLGSDQAPVLYFDYLRPVVRRETQALAASLHWIPVERNQPYTISCDLRASVDGVSAVVGVRAKDAEPRSGVTNHWRKVTLSKSWQRYSFTFRPTRRYVYVTVGPDLDKEMRVDVDVDAIQLEKGEQATAFEPRTSVEVGIEPFAAGGVFVQGDPLLLRMRAQNYGTAFQKVRVDLDCSDYFDKTVTLPPLSVEIPAASGVGREIALPPDWRGYFHVRAKHEAAGFAESQNLRLAIVPARTADDSVLGINHAFVTSFLIQRARKGGVAWYRDWSLKWQDLEPSPGAYRWEVGDAQIDRVIKEGVHLMALMPPFPSSQWASEASPELPGKGYPGERLREAWAPKEPQKLGEFIAKTVSRYKDRVQVWEFLNEPIYTDYALPGSMRAEKYPGKSYSIADYVNLLKVAAAGMRQGDPQCKVMGGIAGPPTHYTREVIEAGGLDQVDIFNLHMYPGHRMPESYLKEMDTLLGIMAEHGGRKPIWITEVSYYGADDLPRRPFIPASNNWSEERLLASERECAELTVRYFVVMLARGVEKIFIHSGSSGSVNDPSFECCLFEYGGVPRKIFPALAVLTELLGPKPKYACEKILENGAYCFGFETGKRAVVVAWVADEDGRATIDAPPRATECLDIMGKKIAAKSVELSGAPVYLIGPAGAAKEMMDGLGR